MTRSWPEHFKPEVVRDVHGRGRLSSYCIALEAWRRGLRVVFKHPQLHQFELSDGTRSVSFNNARPTTFTTQEASATTRDKHATTEALRAADVAAPVSIPFRAGQSSLEDVAQAAQTLGYPVVIKPRNGSEGHGVIAGILDEEELRPAYSWLVGTFKARDYVVERYFDGGDHRVLVIGDAAVAAGVKVPAHIIGDGEHTVDELITWKNAERRSNPYLSKASIKRDFEVDTYIAKQGHTYDSVLEAGVELRLRGKANASAGGDFHDQTDDLPSHIMDAALRSVAAIPGLALAGVDVLYDPSKPRGEDYVIIELNARPHIGLNMYPTHGIGRDVPAVILDTYFPESRRPDITGLEEISINFHETTAPLRSRTVAEVVVQPVPEHGLPVRKTFFVNGLEGLKPRQRIRIMDASRKMDVSGALNEKHGVVVVGGTETGVEDFRARLAAITRCTVSEVSDWEGPMEVGFVIRS